jgi:hypothetical protein
MENFGSVRNIRTSNTGLKKWKTDTGRKRTRAVESNAQITEQFNPIPGQRTTGLTLVAKELAE